MEPEAKTQEPLENVSSLSESVNEIISMQKDGKKLPDAEDIQVRLKLPDNLNEEQRKRFSQPLSDSVTFEELGLSQELLQGVYAMKFVKPSKVQAKALPLLISKDSPTNLICQSQSGTGKTGAFAMALLSQIDATRNQPQGLVLAPARELAIQIADVISSVGKYIKGLSVGLAVKEDIGSKRSSAYTDQIVVGTPGSLLELQKRRILNTENVKILVFDEADMMLDKQGMGSQSFRLRTFCPKKLQILLFSATFNQEVREFADKLVPNAAKISLKREELSVDAIRQVYMTSESPKAKLELLSAIYGLLTIGQSIIFVNTRKTADTVQVFMEGTEGHKTSLLHAGLEPSERNKILEDFRNGVSKVLISTNVLARGIDIPQVSLVINFEIPLDAVGKPDYENYLHRIGRTGRFGREGIAINFVGTGDPVNDQSMRDLLEISKFYGKPIEHVPCDDFEELERKLKEVKTITTKAIQQQETE